MAPNWENNVRVHVFVCAERLADAQRVAAQIASDLGPPGFPVELNRTGIYEDPLTHYGASWQTDSRRKILLPLVAQTAGFSVPESLIIRPGAKVREDSQVWVFDGGTEPDQPGYWSWRMCLDALGICIRGSTSPAPE